MRGVDDGLPTGGGKTHMVTPLGWHLRRWRLDELPQLWNVLIGDMSLVGPRPPTKLMVHTCPALFAMMLKSPPGITGLATFKLARREGRVLGTVRTSAALERLYVTSILPQKMRFERLYAKKSSLWFDLWILGQTVRVILALNLSVDRDRQPSSRRNCGTIEHQPAHSLAPATRLSMKPSLDRVKVAKRLASRHNSDKSFSIGRGLEHW